MPLLQCVAGVEQLGERPRLRPDQLVDRPGGDRGLAQGRNLGGLVALCMLAQLAGELSAPGHELLERGAVELVEVHAVVMVPARDPHPERRQSRYQCWAWVSGLKRR